MLVPLCFLLALTLAELDCAFGTTSCTIKIDKGTVRHSWQTSSFEKLCFANITSNQIGTGGFFHSDKFKNFNDSGFSWFVVELEKPIQTSGIGIENRNCPTCDKDLKEHLSSRASNIESWTSKATNLSFNHPCNATDIGSTFIAMNGSWDYCGETPPPSKIQPGQNLTVTCNRTRMVNYVLLRKKFDSSEADQRQYMGFANMWIVQPRDITVSIEPSRSPLKGSIVTIKCIAHCISAETVRLCRPDGNCSSPPEFHSKSIQPSDSGNYTCKTVDLTSFSSADLKVINPLGTVLISPLNSTSCGVSDSSLNVEFEMTSDPSTNNHCMAWNGVRVHNLEVKSIPQNRNGALKSIWSCSDCSRADRLIVWCNAVLSSGLSHSAEWKCQPSKNLHISFTNVQELPNRLLVGFRFETYDSSPAPNHTCYAAVSASRSNELTPKDTLSANGYTKTDWSESLPWEPGDKLSVRCEAIAFGAWQRSAYAVWQQRQHSFPNWIMALCFIVPIFVIAVIFFLCLYYKLRSLPVKTMDLVRAGAAGTAHAMRCLSISATAVPPYHNVDADNIYEMVHKIGSNEIYITPKIPDESSHMLTF